jgi:hypothetical protein
VRKGWKDDIIYAQLLAEKKEAKYNGTSDLNNDVLTTNETNNEVGGKQQKVAKGKTGMKKQLETNKANNEMFYFGNFGVLINNKDETDEIGEHDLNENSSLIDEEESVQTTKMQSNSCKVSTDNMTDGIFEQNDDVEDGDDEVEDAMSKETDDDFSDEEPVDWRASEYPAEMFQDPLEEVDGKPKHKFVRVYLFWLSIYFLKRVLKHFGRIFRRSPINRLFVGKIIICFFRHCILYFIISVFYIIVLFKNSVSHVISRHFTAVTLHLCCLY